MNAPTTPPTHGGASGPGGERNRFTPAGAPWTAEAEELPAPDGPGGLPAAGERLGAPGAVRPRTPVQDGHSPLGDRWQPLAYRTHAREHERPAEEPPASRPASPLVPPLAPAPPRAPASPPAPAAPPTRPGSGKAPSPGGSPSSDALLIRRTLAEIEPVADKATSYFYALLFVRRPELRALFPAAMDIQRDRLFKALLTAARHADDTAILTTYLSQLGRGHRKYGTAPTHYPAVGECLIDALARHASRTWNDATQAAWVRVYTAISQIMIDAAAEDERSSPPWWQAEIVGHEPRTPDVAIVTVRPDQPYPFLAGQYASVETPWWPRVWRHYSFSCAPREDGLLSFHIKAVPAGWVSGALVHRARPGDVIRLGPPAGSMTVDHGSDSGLLCLGGGTGIAPIKALVEDVVRHGRSRPVEVFYGARHDDDLYDIDTMLRLQKSHRWLSVRPVISDGPTLGLSGQLPQVVRKYGPWNAYDAYLSGPPGMVRSGVDTLVGIGIPAHRIRHDSIDELMASAAG
ncbi:globin domain-containing protein [Streptomyces abikoensis]|uniref:globin domain-containing protein n=1 Tax=Streptomyces abikoensis TaxID=97398 RepID=UPI0033DC3B7E